MDNFIYLRTPADSICSHDKKPACATVLENETKFSNNADPLDLWLGNKCIFHQAMEGLLCPEPSNKFPFRHRLFKGLFPNPNGENIVL